MVIACSALSDIHVLVNSAKMTSPFSYWGKYLSESPQHEKPIMQQVPVENLTKKVPESFKNPGKN